MNNLNDYTNKTKGVIHLLATSLCDRDCQYCCNKSYNLEDIPYVTQEELLNAHTICITGGEPCLFSDPYAIANYYKNKYSNIKDIYLYANAEAYGQYLEKEAVVYTFGGAAVAKQTSITGLSLPIKNRADLDVLIKLYTTENQRQPWVGKSNQLYNFLPKIFNNKKINSDLYKKVQKDFTIITRK
jgi:hypothetical protein